MLRCVSVRVWACFRVPQVPHPLVTTGYTPIALACAQMMKREATTVRGAQRFSNALLSAHSPFSCPNPQPISKCCGTRASCKFSRLLIFGAQKSLSKLTQRFWEHSRRISVCYLWSFIMYNVIVCSHISTHCSQPLNLVDPVVKLIDSL